MNLVAPTVGHDLEGQEKGPNLGGPVLRGTTGFTKPQSVAQPPNIREAELEECRRWLRYLPICDYTSS